MILTCRAVVYLQVDCMEELSSNVYNNDVIVKDLLMTDVVVEKSRGLQASAATINIVVSVSIIKIY